MTSAATEADLLAQINSTLDRIDAKTAELQRAIDSKIGLLPGFLQAGVSSAWNDFCATMRRFWDNLNTIVSNMGSPSALWATSDAWSDRVGVPVSGRVQTADAGLLEVDGTWDGAAAEAYRQMLPMHKVALDKLKATITDGMSTALREVATGILAFWVALAAAAAALVVGIIGALASTASVFGLPAAPFIAAGAGLVASVSIITGCEILKGVCASSNSTLRQKFDDTGFPEGHWPPTVRA